MSKIGIDMDDVIVDFQSGFVSLINGLYGRPPLGTKPVDWAGSNLEVNAEEMANAWAETRKVDNFWRHLDPLPSFDTETYNLLCEAHYDHDIFFISNRYPTVGDTPTWQTKLWLLQNTSITKPNVIITADKGPVAKALELDYFFDDRPKNCEEVLAAVPTCKSFLADASHNQTYFNIGIPRLTNLKAFLKVVNNV